MADETQRKKMQELFPELSDEDANQAAYNWHAFASVINRILKRHAQRGSYPQVEQLRDPES